MFDQFLGESSIHGLRYLTRDTGNLVRLVWLVFVGSSFGVAGYFIYLNVLDWENSPVVVTSVDDVMIEVGRSPLSPIWFRERTLGDFEYFGTPCCQIAAWVLK